MEKASEMVYIDEAKWYELKKENQNLKFQLDELIKSLKILDSRVKKYEESAREKV